MIEAPGHSNSFYGHFHRMPLTAEQSYQTPGLVGLIKAYVAAALHFIAGALHSMHRFVPESPLSMHRYVSETQHPVH
jgi:hypothetical protein